MNFILLKCTFTKNVNITNIFNMESKIGFLLHYKISLAVHNHLYVSESKFAICDMQYMILIKSEII